MTTQWRGAIPTTASNPTQLAYIEGTESITGGTGTYAGARGHGTFEATVDYATRNVVGVEANG